MSPEYVHTLWLMRSHRQFETAQFLPQNHEGEQMEALGGVVKVSCIYGVVQPLIVFQTSALLLHNILVWKQTSRAILVVSISIVLDVMHRLVRTKNDKKKGKLLLLLCSFYLFRLLFLFLSLTASIVSSEEETAKGSEETGNVTKTTDLTSTRPPVRPQTIGCNLSFVL